MENLVNELIKFRDSGQIPPEIQMRLLRKQMDQQKAMAAKLLDMGNQAASQILHQNRASAGHIDTYA